MLRRVLIIVIMTAGAGLGCATGGYEVATLQGKTVKYPSVIADDGKRRQAAIEYWNAFLKERGLPETPADLEPVIGTVRALPAPLAARISITGNQSKLTPLEAREALRNFIDSHAVLFFGENLPGITPHKLLSLTSFSEDGNFYRATFMQRNYPFEIANGYGVMTVALSRQGALLQLSSRLIPSVTLPTAPQIESSRLIERLNGRVFTYSTIAGRSQTWKAESPGTVGKPVVYPLQQPSGLEIRLAIPVEVGQGMTWTVFFDAVDGREIDVRQNFQS